MIVTIQCDHCCHDNTSCLLRNGIFVEKDLDCTVSFLAAVLFVFSFFRRRAGWLYECGAAWAPHRYGGGA